MGEGRPEGTRDPVSMIGQFVSPLPRTAPGAVSSRADHALQFVLARIRFPRRPGQTPAALNEKGRVEGRAQKWTLRMRSPSPCSSTDKVSSSAAFPPRLSK